MQVTTNAVDINAKNIPEREVENLARAILDRAETVMAMPGMMERYEEWKRKKNN